MKVWRIGDRAIIPGDQMAIYLIGTVRERPRWGRDVPGQVWLDFDGVPSRVRVEDLAPMPRQHLDHDLTGVVFEDGVPRCGHCRGDLFRVLADGSALPEPVVRARAL